MLYIVRFLLSACLVFVFTDTVYAAVTCPNGYTTLDTEKHIDTTYKDFSEATFSQSQGETCQVSGYTLIEIPDDVLPVFTGMLIGNEITLCDSGFQVNNGSCATYTQGICSYAFDDLALDNATFTEQTNGQCTISGYTAMETPNDIGTKQNGILIGDEIVLCNNGHRVDNVTCSTYTTDDCPENYQHLTSDENTLTTNGFCPSGYSTFTINQQCDSNTTDAMCVILCGAGLNYTGVGTCAQTCSLGQWTTLRTSTGLIYPMYTTKQITPSINLSDGNSVCYVNLVPGSVEGALHFKYNNQTYHAVQ